MKTKLTPEESAKLIELGVSPERASESESSVAYGNGAREIMKTPQTPIFTLAELIDILPEEVYGSTLGMEYDCEFKQWWVGYRVRHLESAPELIDAIYSLLVWCLVKGHVKD